jgi:hypothetical protein
MRSPEPPAIRVGSLLIANKTNLPQHVSVDGGTWQEIPPVQAARIPASEGWHSVQVMRGLPQTWQVVRERNTGIDLTYPNPAPALFQ